MSWPLVPASEIMVKRGGSLNPAKFPEETFELLSIPAFDKDKPEILKGAEIGSSKNCIEPGDVLLSKIVPHIRRCWVVPEKGDYRQIGSGEWIIFRDERFDPGFLKHYFTSELFHRQFMNTVAGVGGSLVRARPAGVERIEIPLPPLEEQKRIATILDKADAIRRKRQQAIQLADEFLRAVFLDMFGDPVTNPKGWEVETLSSLVVGKLQNGAYFPKEKYSSKGVEMVHMADAFYDVVPRGQLKRVNASAKEIEKYGLGVEDIMISRRSLNYEGAAKPTLIPESSEPLIFESSMIRLTPNPELINKRYLFQYLSDPSVKDHHVRKYVTGATIKGISQKNLEKVEVLVPPLDMQRKFEESATSIERFVAKHSFNKSMGEDLFLSISQNFLC